MHTETDIPQALTAHNELETLEIEVIPKGSIRRAPQSAAPMQKAGASVTMSLTDWVETDRTMWELYGLVEIAIQQRDEALETLRARDLERDLMATRLREWKTYARAVEERLHRSQLRNVELTYALRAMADVARQAIGASPFAVGLRQQLTDRFNQIARELR